MFSFVQILSFLFVMFEQVLEQGFCINWLALYVFFCVFGFLLSFPLAIWAHHTTCSQGVCCVTITKPVACISSYCIYRKFCFCFVVLRGRTRNFLPQLSRQFSYEDNEQKKKHPITFNIAFQLSKKNIIFVIFSWTLQMSTMPGLPTRPCFYDIDLDPVTEEVLGLF